MEAHGALNKTLIFARLGGTSYVKNYNTPANPKSSAQMGIRCMSKFLTQNWSALTEPQKAKFQTLAEEWNLSRYHAYLRFNSQRWNAHLLPTADLDSINIPSGADQIVTITKTGRLHEISHTITFEAITPFGAECCFATASDFTPAKSNAKVIINKNTGFFFFREITGEWLAPDDATYYCKSRYFLRSGNASSFILQS